MLQMGVVRASGAEACGFDSTGLAMDKKRCKNPVARQLVDDARRIVEIFNKSDAAKVQYLGMKVQKVE